MQFKRESILPITLSQQTVDFTCHHYISKQKTPDLLNKLSTGELFQVTDTKTNVISPVQFPCVYEDTQKQFLVFYNPNNTIDSEQFGISLFEDLTEDYSHYNLRVTTTLADFFEKINVMDAQQLDTEVEAVKILTFTLLKEQQPQLKDFNLHFYDVNGERAFVVLSKDGQTLTQYRPELVNIVTKKLGDKLHLSKGVLHHVNVKWAIDVLELNNSH